MREIFLNTNNQASLVPKGKPAQLAAVVEPWLEHKEACKQQGIQNAAAAEAFFGITAFRSRLHIILNRIQEQLLRWQADGTGPLVSPVPSGKIPVQKVPSIVHRKRRKKKQERRYLENPGLLIQNPGGGPSIKIVRFIGKDGGTGGIQSGESN
ncbi:hypothetical protein P7H20_00170 [Paenibacillus larvae]|nr:hypothetical protein [Paenibacillus larvae]MDT2273621.1 hypothetical protein [Paenibacillus larvae]